MSEVWKDVPGFEGLYQVSNIGRVKSLARVVPHPGGDLTIKARYLRPGTNDRYPYVFLSIYGKPRRFRIHTLVLTAFAGPAPEGHECRHLNDNSADNRWPENLVWGTSAQNKADMIANGGTLRRNFKLSQAQADEIRSLRGVKTQEELARINGVSQGAISLIHQGKTWAT
jgi:NUMOD4 motif/HNH endonuclease